MFSMLIYVDPKFTSSSLLAHVFDLQVKGTDFQKVLFPTFDFLY